MSSLEFKSIGSMNCTTWRTALTLGRRTVGQIIDFYVNYLAFIGLFSGQK